MKPSAYDLSLAGDKYLGTPYSEMDCQAFVEACLRDVGIKKDLPGSNAWYRAMTWTGSPEKCKEKFGKIPVGAFLFILKHDGGEPDKYKPDGLGNASHMGIYTDRGKGAINSSYSRGCVCESEFHGKAIPGGWNIVGLWDALSYGERIDKLLAGQEAPKEDESGGGGKPMGRAKVVAKHGKTVNLRASASTSARVLVQVPVGEDVDILDHLVGWDQVQWKNYSGYMMSEFLDPIPEEGGEIGTPEEGTPNPGEAGTITITLDSDLAYDLWMRLGDALGENGPEGKG